MLTFLFALTLSSYTNAQTCVQPPAGLVSWWPGDGNANDIIGGNHGTLQNGATFAIGKVGQGFSFDGVDDDVFVPASPALNVGAGNGLTIDAWINPIDISSQHPLVEWGNVGTHFWISVTSQGGVPNNLYANLVDINGNYHIIQSATGVISANTYQHVAVTYDKSTGTATLYHNGTVVTQQNLGVFTLQTTYDLYFGKRAGLTTYWGTMDEVGLFNRALSAEEIQAIFNAGSAGKCKSAEPICDIQMSQASYVNGETVTAEVLRIANPTADPLAIELKLWFDVPTIPPISFMNIGANGDVVLPAGFDQNLGPLLLATVTEAFPRGTYGFNCRILHPVSGGLLVEDLNPFDIQ